MDLDYSLMQELSFIEDSLKELEAGYRKKYFRKDITRHWSFKCYHCGKKVASNVAEEYWIISMMWKDPYTMGRRFCSKVCADIYFNEERSALLARYEQIIEDRKLLREFYEEAERKFMEVRDKR